MVGSRHISTALIALAFGACAQGFDFEVGAGTDTTDLGDTGSEAGDADASPTDADTDDDVEDTAVDGSDAGDIDATDTTDTTQDVVTCSPGETRCAADGGGVETCDAFGEAWGASEACADACVSAPEAHCPMCTPGEVRCASELALEACDTNALWQPGEVCGEDTLCVVDTCAPTECEPGTQLCSGEVLLTCSEAGVFEPRNCIAETSFCSGTDCTPWQCIPGESLCASTALRLVCDARGAAFIDVPCGDEAFCRDGACVPRVCLPGEQWCSADYGAVLSCNAAGDDWVEVACGPGTRCDTDGAVCAPSYCGDGFVDPRTDEVCDDGNTVDCDGCGACRPQQALLLNPATTSAPITVVTSSSGRFGVDFWVRVDGTDGLLHGVGDPGGVEYVFFQVLGGDLLAELAFSEGAGFTLDGGPIVDGQWHYVALARTSERMVGLYVDGRVVAAGEVPGTDIDVLPDIGVWVGAPQTTLSPVSAVDAALDDVRWMSGAVPREQEGTPPQHLTSTDETVFYLDFDVVALGDAVEAVSATPLVVDHGTLVPQACRGGHACGDGVLAPWEWCDDGNIDFGDGCGPTCDAECASLGRLANDRCLWVDAPRRGDQADDACAGGRRAVLREPAEAIVAAGLAEEEMWFGLTVELLYVLGWVDGGDYRESDGWWEADQPRRSSSRITYEPVITPTGLWSTVRDTETHPVLCQTGALR